MSFYSALAATALSLLTTYGVTCSLGPTSRSVKAARVKTVVKTFSDGANSFASSGVRVGDVEFLLESGASPALGERLVIAGQTFVIVAIDPIKPADTVVVWQAWGRVG